MQRLMIVILFGLLSVSSGAIAKNRKPVERQPHPGTALSAAPDLSPEAARMAAQRQLWPNRPVTDDGGYRIRPKIGQ
jgi:hypothetical protein